MITVLTNTTIWDREGDAIAISSDGKIKEVGYEVALLRKFPGSRIIDLNGSIILPGLHESHAHPSIKTRWSIDLTGVKSIDEIKHRLKTFIRRGNPPYIIGRGWNEESLREGRPPNRWDLDEVSNSIPILLFRVCGHIAVANTKALKLAGINERNIKNELTRFIEVEDGRVTGLIKEDGVNIIRNTFPKPSKDEIKEGLANLLREYVSYGIVAINFMNVVPEYVEILESLSGTPGMPRIAVYTDLKDINKVVGSKLLAGIKLFADGSLGGRTAYLREPYTDDPHSRGIYLLKNSEITKALDYIKELKLQLAIHVIGDAAIEKVLDILTELNIPSNLIRLEHVSLAPPDIIEKVSNYGPHVVIQPHFLVSDWWADKRLGNRVRYLYPFRSMLKYGIKLYGSSDYPVEPLNPFLSISASITRGLMGRWSWDESLDIESAIDIYRGDPCFGGTLISEGMPADLVVLSENPKNMSGYDVSALKPSLVLISGAIAYVDRNFFGELY
jgi:hypothetical protein